MSVIVLLVLPLIMAAVLAVVVLVVVALTRSAPAPSEAAAAARRHGGVVAAAAWLALVATPVLLLPALRGIGTISPGLLEGLATGLLPSAAGLAALGVHALGERAWPRPTGTVRRAHLTPRRARDVVPVWLGRLTAAWGVVLMVVLVALGATATPDGRRITRVQDAMVSTASPYPGWFYGAPIAIGTLLLLAATALVLRQVARRPAVVDADPEYDAASRRLSGHRVLRGSQLVVALTLAAVLWVAGGALGRVDLTGAAITSLVLAVAVGLTGLFATLVPAAPATPAPGAPGAEHPDPAQHTRLPSAAAPPR
jgi:hypothetical protein